MSYFKNEFNFWSRTMLLICGLFFYNCAQAQLSIEPSVGILFSNINVDGKLIFTVKETDKTQLFIGTRLNYAFSNRFELALDYRYYSNRIEVVTSGPIWDPWEAFSFHSNSIGVLVGYELLPKLSLGFGYGVNVFPNHIVHTMNGSHENNSQFNSHLFDVGAGYKVGPAIIRLQYRRVFFSGTESSFPTYLPYNEISLSANYRFNIL